MTAELKLLLQLLLGLLLIASLIGWILKKKFRSDAAAKTIANLNARILSWWWMAGIFTAAVILGHGVTTALYAMLSFLALREFLTLNPTARADHEVMFWCFAVILPLHYTWVAVGWYGMFSIFIPVYAFVFIPFRRVLAGETTGFLASTAKIQWALLVCVYALSHLPMILRLPLPEGSRGGTAGLLFFLVITVQLSDVLQYTWGKTCGRRPVAPSISPSKTWEGTVGGILTTVILSSCLYWATPFHPWQAAVLALLLCVVGFFGGLVMSAIKRDLGAKDWGSSIAGHGGILDRLDSLCFAAPLYFHLVGFYFGTGMHPEAPGWLLRWLGK